MNNLGTFSTIDCPFIDGDPMLTKQKIAEARSYLEGALHPYFTVRVHNNPHDFGEYKSFEIDWAEDYEHLENYDEDDSSDDDTRFHDAAIETFNETEDYYSKKFAGSV